MSELQEARWYVVQTYSGHENKVKATIEKAVKTRGMEDYITQLVVPTEDVVETTKTGKEKTRQRKVFPSYVLVKMIITDESWYIVRNTPGVTGFIGSSGKGAKPFPLTKPEVDKILGNMGMSRIDVVNEINEGDTVKVINGAFSNMFGKVKFVDMVNQKIEVVLDLFGQETIVEVLFTEIEKA